MLGEAIATGARAAAAAASLGMTSEQQVTAAIQAVITSGQDVLSQATSTASTCACMKQMPFVP